MIRLRTDIEPEKKVLDKLEEYQKEIDRLSTFEDQSAKAKDVFPKRNKRGNTTFDAVKLKLTEMCSGARRCVYCEDSVADEVEHIYPKDLYPEMCFCWENYVYACGNCNGPKNNKFAVFRKSDGEFQEVNPPHGTKASKPPDGESVMINPRYEDPLEYCMLDLADTFKFVVIASEGTKEHKRTDYTFNEVLRLNEREFLRIARKEAYAGFKARLYEYTHRKAEGASLQQLNNMIEGIKRESHPTVWKEMQRYHRRDILKNVDNDLNHLFLQSPEAIDW